MNRPEVKNALSNHPTRALVRGLEDAASNAEGFDQAFIAYCEKIAEIPPLAATQTKRRVSRIALPGDLESHLRDELTDATRGFSLSADPQPFHFFVEPHVMQ